MTAPKWFLWPCSQVNIGPCHEDGWRSVWESLWVSDSTRDPHGFNALPLSWSLNFRSFWSYWKNNQTLIEVSLHGSWNGVPEEPQNFSWQCLPLGISHSGAVPNASFIGLCKLCYWRNSFCNLILTLGWADFQTLWHTASYLVSLGLILYLQI